MEACIEDVYYAEIDDSDEGLNVFTTREFLDHVRTSYSAIDQTLIDENLTKLEKPIQADLPLNVYTRKQERYQVFAA